MPSRTSIRTATVISGSPPKAGVSRYQPQHTPPAIRLKDIVADRHYGPQAEVDISAAQDFLIFEFQGRSFTTPPDRMAYVYQLQDHDPELRWTRDQQVEYTDLPIGQYVFQVQAVDRDLSYSETPVEVRVTIHPPYATIALAGGLALALVGLIIASTQAVKRRRERDQAREQLVQELEEELQTAHEMQMGLMPASSPQIEDFDIAGRCIPANHVGGDFFQYFQRHNQWAMAMADVTGHAMEAAIPAVMFNGILESQLELDGSIEDLFGRLNHSLHRTLDSRTFVCFVMGQFDPTTRTMCLANSGCPYPYHFRAARNEAVELQLDAYPLGVRQTTSYAALEIQLEPGDRIVFCSDGIVEATNAAAEMFGFERTAATIQQGCEEDLSAADLLQQIIAAVNTFAGGAPQEDDRTVVVLKVEN